MFTTLDLFSIVCFFLLSLVVFFSRFIRLAFLERNRKNKENEKWFVRFLFFNWVGLRIYFIKQAIYPLYYTLLLYGTHGKS